MLEPTPHVAPPQNDAPQPPGSVETPSRTTSPEARRTRRRRRSLLVACAAVLGVVLAVPLSLPLWARQAFQAALSGSVGRRVHVEAVRVRWVPLELDIRDLRIDGTTASAPPFFESPRVLIRASLGSLWTRGRALSRLDLQSPTLRINAFPGGGDDIPHGQAGGPGSSVVSIRRLTIHSGQLVLNHQRVPLALSLSDVEGQLRRGSDGALAGTISFSQGTVAEGNGPALPIAAALDLSLSNAMLAVRQGTVRTRRSNLAVSGSLQLLAGPIGEFALSGPVDLEELDTSLWRTGLGIRGDGRYEGRLAIAGARLALNGRLSGTNGMFNRVAVPEYSGELRWDPHGVTLHGLSVRTLDGEADIDFAYPSAPEPTRLRATYKGVDAERAVRAIFHLGPIGLASSATGTADLAWPRGRTRALSGHVAFDLTDRSDGRPPAHGRFEWQAKDGHQEIRQAVIESPTTTLRLSGAIDPHNRIDLAVEGDSSDLAWTDDMGMRLRQALGNGEARAFGFSGRGAFKGLCRGTLSVPLYDGTFSGRDFGFMGVRWGRADWAGSASPDEVRCHSLVLRQDGRELWLDGWLETGDFAERDRVDLTLRSKQWPAEDIATALQWDVAVHGPMTAAANVHGRRSAPNGEVHATLDRGDVYGVPFEDLKVDLLLRGRAREISSARARIGEGELLLRGTLTDEGMFDAAASVRNVDLRDVLPAPSPWPSWSGKISGDATFQGTMAHPWLQARFSSPGLSWGGVELGPATLAADGAGQSTLGLAVTCRSEHLDARLDGRTGALSPFPANLRLTLRESALDPIVRVLFPRFPAEAGLVTTGTLNFAGQLTRARDAVVDVDLADLRLLLPDYSLRNPDPVVFSVRDGRLRIGEAHLAGEGTNLTISGSADLIGQGPLALSLRGDADLRALSVWTERVRGRGAAHLQLALAGSRHEPQIEGRLDITGAGLRLRGFPHGLEDVEGAVLFTERGARLEGLRATLGGGTLEAEGDAAFAAARLASFEVRTTGRGIGLRYPEGLRSLFDADLRVAGDADRQWVTGDILLREALWTRRYDVSAELLSVASPTTAREDTVGQSVSYDVRLHAPGTLRVDNNLAALDARAELSLVGTLDNPIVLGRADIERGRVYFHGNTYVLRRGTIDFSDPRRIDPFFDIEAETGVRGYRVVLSAVGTLERVNPTLTSDPPLSPLQILNLLAGADESAVTSFAQAQRDQTYLAATGAATLAAGRLSEEFGLERGAQRLLGLNRFSIDPRTITPALAEGALSTAARLTIGKRITPDLSVLYAQDLGGQEERLLSLELTLSDRISLLLTRDQVSGEGGELGFDVLLRHSQ